MNLPAVVRRQSFEASVTSSWEFDTDTEAKKKFRTIPIAIGTTNKLFCASLLKL